MDKIYVLGAGLEICFAFVSTIIFVGCIFDRTPKNRVQKVFVLMLILNIIMNLVDACIWVWVDAPRLKLLMRVLSCISYILGGIILVMFSLLITSYIRQYIKISKWVFFGVIIVGILMIATWMVFIFGDTYYYWDDNGVCQNGRFFWLSQLYGILFLVFDAGIIVAYRKYLEKKESIVLIIYSVIPLGSFVVTYLTGWEATPLYGGITLSMLIYYIILHVEHGQRIAEQENKLMKQELELSSSRTAIMLSQIQPHFLYNSLTAIAMLCEKEPRQARDTILAFSEYLRQNMSSLKQKEPIPFAKELEHVQSYLAIENIRFGENLHVIYGIETKNFKIPALSLQPIVENAVKHGICKREDGGTVSIKTKEIDDGFFVIVDDDGKGFEKDEVSQDGKVHTGLSNVEERLRVLAGGTLQVQSKPGYGTTVTMFIPKGGM